MSCGDAELALMHAKVETPSVTPREPSVVITVRRVGPELIAAVPRRQRRRVFRPGRRYQDTCTRLRADAGSRVDATMRSVGISGLPGLRSCKDPAHFGGWLYQIVINECRTYASRQRKRDLRFPPSADAIERAVAPGSEEEVDRDVGGHIERALSMLPTEQREAFLLKHVEELTYDEMAAMTGVSVPALKMRVKRACDGLRDLLEGVYNG